VGAPADRVAEQRVDATADDAAGDRYGLRQVEDPTLAGPRDQAGADALVDLREKASGDRLDAAQRDPVGDGDAGVAENRLPAVAEQREQDERLDAVVVDVVSV
jgi:hypothetical protein